MREKSRRWIVLLGLTFVVALVVAVLILVFYGPSGQPFGRGAVTGDLPVNFASDMSAQSAYLLAVDVARSWQPDGQVAIVSAHWQPRQGSWAADVVWMFQFYSTAARRLAVIVVDGGRARLLQESSSPYPLPVFGEDDWQVDSLAALETWWNAGGATFVAIHSDVDLTAQLRVREEDDRLAWTVIGTSGVQMRRLIVDGVTGDLVQD